MSEFEQHYQDQLEAIELNGATFHVRLPTSDNVRFQRAVGSVLITDFDAESGEFERKEVSVQQMIDLQVEAFVTTSIRRVEGWDGYSTEALLAMPDACDDLWQAACERKMALEGKAEAELKKPLISLTGQDNGPDEESSTKSLRHAAK